MACPKLVCNRWRMPPPLNAGDQVADAMAKDHRAGTNHIKSSKTLQNYLDRLNMIYYMLYNIYTILYIYTCVYDCIYIYIYILPNINLQPSTSFNEFHAHPCNELPHPARKHPFFQEGHGPQCQVSLLHVAPLQGALKRPQALRF